MKQAVFPLNLPFDLWIGTVRGFLGYFNIALATVLDTLRPVDNLELFGDANDYPYYRAQILAESLHLSPSDYGVLTTTAAALSPLTDNWFTLYGYPSETAALHGTAELQPLSSAENLAQLLGLSYEQLTELVSTGFLNPALYPLIYQFQRFGIEMSDAFSYTGQPGYPPLTDVAAFEAQLQAITARYKTVNPASTFDAATWLKDLLPADYSSQVLVLADPDSGCDFAATTLTHAGNLTAATPLDYVKLNLLVRLWQKLGWSLDELDRAMQAFFPPNLPAWTEAGFGAAFTAAWKTALVYLAHLDNLNTDLRPAAGRVALLPFWADLPVDGTSPLYATLFLTPSVLNNDWAFDDPNGEFPVPLSDLTAASLQAFAAHLASVQGVLGLTADDVSAILTDAGTAVDQVAVSQGGQTVQMPAFTLGNLSICYRYSTLATCLHLDVDDLIALKQMSGLDPFQPVTGTAITALAGDVLFNTTQQFLTEAQTVQASGFEVEDLQYLLRHQFNPVGKYQTDENALLGLLQSTAAGLAAIQSQNTVPANLASVAESLLDQLLSGLFPAAILKSLFQLLTNGKDFGASQSGLASAIDPTPFAAESGISFSYDPTTQTQTVTYAGMLLDWKKAELLALSPSAALSVLLDGIQAEAAAELRQRFDDILGVWASLVQYEAVETNAAAGLPAAPLMSADPALSLGYDEVGQLQWASYRGVLTDAAKASLAAVTMPSAALTDLLNNILADLQTQAMPAYRQLAGSLLAMLTDEQTFEAQATGILAANQVDAAAFFVAVGAAQQDGTITSPVPALNFGYDPATQIQTLTCQGVLTDALRGQLAGLPGVSATCTGLLQSVRDSMAGLFETLAAGLLTVAVTDLDTLVVPFLGPDPAKAQRGAKAELVRVFQPLLATKLSRQFVIGTLSSNLSADASLTEALITDAALLADPSNPGRPLIGSFLALGQPGVSAAYFTPGSSTPQATGTAATPDTTDPTNTVAGLSSCHFEGYLQVPTDGPYRFYAELGNAGATASFQLDSPALAALLPSPIISAGPAPADHAEVSAFVTLQAGVLYHFTLDFANLGSNGASLLVQGEDLAKGPLDQLALNPESSVTSFVLARKLLAKGLQILSVTSLDVREISYLLANADEFSDLRLSSLPTQTSDDSLANAVSLFAQMLTLLDYADLRKNPAGGSDGLIAVFQGVGTTFTEAPSSQSSNANPLAPWTALASLTRRNAADVRAISEYFGLIDDVVAGPDENVTAVGDLGNNKGIRRIWAALQLIHVLGIPVSAVTACTAIASPSPPASAQAPAQVATNFKNAVRAQYAIDEWLPIAQSVFDPLRRAKRDALVSYLVNALSLDSPNQLFEYFLVDPGMEPVVQTSRLRLAMSSLQTFVQRCFLNLEDGNAVNPSVNVSPMAIDADWWSWMKRYRLWEANREIFLFPENWMEPELRTGMSDLFQSLESALLQGDVTDDLADDAFLAYLEGLEQRARLERRRHLPRPEPHRRRHEHAARGRPDLQPSPQVLLPHVLQRHLVGVGVRGRQDRGRPRCAGVLERSAQSLLGDVHQSGPASGGTVPGRHSRDPASLRRPHQHPLLFGGPGPSAAAAALVRVLPREVDHADLLGPQPLRTHPGLEQLRPERSPCPRLQGRRRERGRGRAEGAPRLPAILRRPELRRRLLRVGRVVGFGRRRDRRRADADADLLVPHHEQELRPGAERRFLQFRPREPLQHDQRRRVLVSGIGFAHRHLPGQLRLERERIGDDRADPAGGQQLRRPALRQPCRALALPRPDRASVPGGGGPREPVLLQGPRRRVDERRDGVLCPALAHRDNDHAVELVGGRARTGEPTRQRPGGGRFADRRSPGADRRAKPGGRTRPHGLAVPDAIPG